MLLMLEENRRQEPVPEGAPEQSCADSAARKLRARLKKHILGLIEKSRGEGCTVADLLRSTHRLSRDQLRWILRQLRAEGRICSVGQTKAARWVPAGIEFQRKAQCPIPRVGAPGDSSNRKRNLLILLALCAATRRPPMPNYTQSPYSYSRSTRLRNSGESSGSFSRRRTAYS
jgi:hypothetical protein